MSFRLRLGFLGALMAVVYLVGPPLDAQACICIPNPPCRLARFADAAFVGTVTDVQTGDGWGNRALIRIEEALHGLDEAEGKEVVVDGSSSSSCGMEFQKGVRYIVYADGSPERWSAGQCGGTKMLERAGEDLQYWRGLRTAPMLGRAYGEIRAWSQNEPLNGVRILLKGPGVERETKTNGEGKYEFAGLPPGRYTLKVEGTGKWRGVSRDVKIYAHGCTWVDFYAKGRKLEAYPYDEPEDEQ